MTTSSLVRYDAMCRAINACHRVDEIKTIRDKAIAFEAYAKEAKNAEAERKAREIRLRAERRAGQLLKQMKSDGQRATARQNLKRGPKSSPTTSEATLKDLGVTRDQSSQWQQLGDVPEEQFEEALHAPAKKASRKSILGKQKRERTKTIDRDALWLWGRLRDFEDSIIGRSVD